MQEISLQDKILQARKRHQPYLNLVNQNFSIGDVLSEENLDAYKKIKLKSLYFSTTELCLDKKLATQLKNLTEYSGPFV